MRLFSDDQRFQPIYKADNGQAALASITRFQPDVAILALTMLGLSGFEITARVSAENRPTRCIILTVRGERVPVRRLVQAGARACLPKEAAFEELADLVQRVAADQSGLAGIDQVPETEPEPVSELSKRELEVLHFVARGLTSKQIARAMYISPYTVDSHRQRIMQKLAISNGPGLVRYAIHHGIT